LGHVTVLNNNTLEITGKWSAVSSGYNASLYFSDDGFVWNKLQNTNTVFSINHNNLQVAETQYYYRNIVFNPCQEACDSSVVHSNIVLTRSGFSTNWNPYKPWASPLNNSLQKKSNTELYWTSVYTGSNTTYFLPDTGLGVCFRVKATKNTNDDSSLSNLICLFVRDTTLIPSGLNPEGNNPIFKIVNPNIAPGQSVMSIYDRWGGKLWEGDALQGWNGKYNGDFLPMGMYIYKVVVKRKEKNELFSGTVFLIR